MSRLASQLDRAVAAVETEFADAVSALHRIRIVRRQQGIDLRGLARRTKESVYVLEREELPATDLLLSRLHRWHQWLDVPLADLLVEPEVGLSPRVLERARLIRIMKTARSLGEEVDFRQEVTRRGTCESLELTEPVMHICTAYASRKT
jgi:transcriptional regulator with XRE-family HTH domain